MGITLSCPVFAEPRPYVHLSTPYHVAWPDTIYSHEFDDDILAQIREVDPAAFEDSNKVDEKELNEEGR